MHAECSRSIETTQAYLGNKWTLDTWQQYDTITFIPMCESAIRRPAMLPWSYSPAVVNRGTDNQHLAACSSTSHPNTELQMTRSKTTVLLAFSRQRCMCTLRPVVTLTAISAQARGPPTLHHHHHRHSRSISSIRYALQNTVGPHTQYTR